MSAILNGLSEVIVNMLKPVSGKTKRMRQPNLHNVVKRARTGLGLFAVKPIPKGKRIIEYTGPLVSNEEVDRRGGKYFFGVNTKWSIDGSPRTNIARYINHSCKPNADALLSGRRVWIWSNKNIKAGEEITYDYGKEYFEDVIKPMGCRCAACGSSPKRARTKLPGRQKTSRNRKCPSGQFVPPARRRQP